jgi:hypothetical protein
MPTLTTKDSEIKIKITEKINRDAPDTDFAGFPAGR